MQFLFLGILLLVVGCNGEAHPRWNGQCALSSPVDEEVFPRQVSSNVLRDFQVTAPVYAPPDAKCEQTLMVHSFGNSYGQPFVGPYNPPSCDFNRVVMNFTVTSKGRQFDRLALMYLNDTEVFRTSTAEPTANGIIWTYTKDMSALLSLFKEPQKLIFDLGNLIDQTYTGPFNTTLSATYFMEANTPAAADMVIPVSGRMSSSNQPSAFVLPAVTAINNLTLPRNIKKAYFTLSACGQANEEFWWSNVPSSTTQTFSNTTLLGFSPWREVQLLIDGSIAGVAWPFPVIFTGGVVPGFWRPIVGIDAFDLKEDEIDISPFIPILADGKSHKFEIRVVGINDDGKGHASIAETVGDNWVVTGKIFLWLDDKGSTTTGIMSIRNVSNPEFHVISGTQRLSNGTNTTLTYSVLAQRNLEINSTIKTSEGEQVVSWRQSISFSNTGEVSDGGNTEVNSQMTSGAHQSSNGYSRIYSYPLYVWNTFSDNSASGGNLTISGKMDRSKDEEVLGRGALDTPVDALPPSGDSDSAPSYTGYSIRNRQNGTADLVQNNAKNISASSGETEQTYELSGEAGSLPQNAQAVPDYGNGKELYSRHVIAKNAAVILDKESPVMDEGFIANDIVSNPGLQMLGYPMAGVRGMLGRGPA
ncbi:hypothetical protein NA57DRAFT_65370 [Rhizodiscina lignyota]|uniref:Peptide N-acetyl-beta-D-glucosaminyl asparaginase amidase A N-terminal domain-containing protein n=1 Tax=Rhizodiscina lignyota TaxID=1504668 RepID=A0A9P4MB69_9PEZI|nr:hypothetical protein NA57DRAFT_65370 [Rhizodiscina lignyota]